MRTCVSELAACITCSDDGQNCVCIYVYLCVSIILHGITSQTAVTNFVQ